MMTLMLAWPGCPVYTYTDHGLQWSHSRSYDAGTAPLIRDCVYPSMHCVVEHGINLSGTFSVYYTGTGDTVPMALAGESRPWPVEWVVAEALHANRAAAEAAPRFLETMEGQGALAAACAMYAAARDADPDREVAIAWAGTSWTLVTVGPGNRESVQPYHVEQYRQNPKFSSTASPPLLWRPTVDPECWWASC